MRTFSPLLLSIFLTSATVLAQTHAKSSSGAELSKASSELKVKSADLKLNNLGEQIKKAMDVGKKVKAFGPGGSGGGDSCENRFYSIRDDVVSWIQKGGSENLRLPSFLSIELYNSRMLEAIGEAKVKCVDEGDVGYPVEVEGTPKVCKFEIGDDFKSITCDHSKFLKTEQSAQYVLVHHEYAGLAGIENPNGAASDYSISNQITGFLENFLIKKLVIKKAQVQITPALEKLRSEFADAHLPSDDEIRLGQKVSGCKFFDYHGVAVDLTSFRFTRLNGILRYVEIKETKKFGFFDVDQELEHSERWFAPSDKGIKADYRHHAVGPREVEIRATDNGDLIWEWTAVNINNEKSCALSAVDSPRCAIAYIICPKRSPK